jgi:hypothetical protein
MGKARLTGPPRPSALLGAGPRSDGQVTAQPVRPSILHCKPALNLLSSSSVDDVHALGDLDAADAMHIVALVGGGSRGSFGGGVRWLEWESASNWRLIRGMSSIRDGSGESCALPLSPRCAKRSQLSTEQKTGLGLLTFLRLREIFYAETGPACAATDPRLGATPRRKRRRRYEFVQNSFSHGRRKRSIQPLGVRRLRPMDARWYDPGR